MKINPRKIFNTTVFCLFAFFVSLYLASASGYYEYENKEQTKFTEEKMKEFENDLKKGKKVDLKDYLEVDTVKYDNKITNFGQSLSDILNDSITHSLEKTFKFIEKLIE